MPALAVVRGRILISQISERLKEEGVPHGVFMASARTPHPIQCVSVDTAISRKEFPEAKFIVIDECHDAVSESYKILLEQYPDALVLGVSATPFGDLRHVGETILHPIGIRALTELGFLVRLRYFAPSTIDVSGVQLDAKTKDYKVNQLAAASQKGTITGDIVSHWQKLAHGRPTLAFCVNIEHAQNMAAAFTASGIRATTLTGSDPLERRNFVFENLGGYYQVVTSVGVLTRGVDIPHASCLIIARPTQSETMWIQILGRGTRPAPGKEDCLVLDHAGNCARHGFLENEPEISERDGSKKGPGGSNSVYTCKACFGVSERPVEICPYCGTIVPVSERKPPKQQDGELKELTEDPLYEAKRVLKKLKAERKQKGYKRGWIYFRMVSLFGEAIANELVPKRKIPPWLALSGKVPSDLGSGSSGSGN